MIKYDIAFLLFDSFCFHNIFLFIKNTNSEFSVFHYYLSSMSHHEAVIRDVLQELGAPPELPTTRRLKNLVAKIEPERLQQAKTDLKDVFMKRNQDTDHSPTTLFPSPRRPAAEKASSEPSSQINRTHILEMELLKLKGEFHKNKTTTKHLIKKLTNERELVKDSIKELSSTRREELDLVGAIKRDNVELMQRKQELEVDLMDLSERMEMLLGSLGETQKSVREKEQKLQSVEMERFEMSKQIETLELKLKLNNFEPKREVTSKASCDWGAYLANVMHTPLCFQSVIILLLSVAFLYYCYQRVSVVALAEPLCKDCDYERDIFTRIKI